MTPENIAQWLGDDLSNPEEMAALLADIVNGAYPIEQLRQDIKDTLGDNNVN